jgi:uncharacterized protein
MLLTEPLMVIHRRRAFGAHRDGMESHGRARSEKKQLIVLEGKRVNLTSPSSLESAVSD